MEAFHQFFSSVERFSLLNVDALISHFYLSHQESRQSWNRKVENNSSQFLLTILKTIWNSKDEIIHKTWKLKRKKTLYISYAHSQYVKMLENQNRNWIRIDKKKSAKAYLGTFIPHDQKTIHVLFLQQKFLLKNEL